MAKSNKANNNRPNDDEDDTTKTFIGNKTMEWLLEPGRFKMKPEIRRATCKTLYDWFMNHILLIITFSGVSLGIVLGMLLRNLDLSANTIMLIAYPGELFMRLLKLMILPLVIASLITGAASLNARMNGMIALRTVVYFLTTSLISSLIGLALVLAIHPGNPETKEILGEGDQEGRNLDILDNFLDLGRNLLPDNIFQASFQTAQTEIGPDESRTISYRAGTNTLGIIFFCLVFGTVLGTLGKKGQIVINFFTVIDEVIMKMVIGIMWISPVGIGSVICAKILSVAKLGVVMSQLGLFILTVTGGIFFYQFVVLQLIYFIFVRKNPFKFWWGCFQSWITAFATASTAAALPVSFRCMLENNKVDPRISKFVLPIGATVNMDGTALFVTTASIFIAQMNNMQLDGGQLLTVVLTSTATSIAAASVPSAALVLMLIVLTAIDAPIQDVSLLWAIDWFVDRCRTTNNMLGDLYGAAIIEALSKKQLDEMDRMRKEEALHDDLEKQNKSDASYSVTKDDDHEEESTIESAGGSINGSSVEVPEVIVVDSNKEMCDKF